jgi:hypothetical protein
LGGGQEVSLLDFEKINGFVENILKAVQPWMVIFLWVNEK